MQRFKKAGEGELEMVYLSLSFRFTNESVTQSTYIIATCKSIQTLRSFWLSQKYTFFTFKLPRP